MKVTSNSEISRIAIIASGMTAIIFPITPLTKSNGMKANTVVATEAPTEGSTSTVPSIAARSRPVPRCRCV